MYLFRAINGLRLRGIYGVDSYAIDAVLEKHGIHASLKQEAKNFPQGFVLKWSEDWNVVTAALRGEISESRAKEYFHGKISFDAVMKGVVRHEKSIAADS